MFCDVSKAFDRVWHKGLLFKLNYVGIKGTLLQRLTGYLKDRKQRVVLPKVASDWCFIKAGVPQGSILRPLLVLVCRRNKLIYQDFAHDTSLYIMC